MIERSFTLVNPTGLHARPAAVFVKAAMDFAGTEIVVRNGDKEASALSLIRILSLGAGAGSTITLRCSGPREEEAIATLGRLLESGLGEQPK
jgi:phosphocarrier protein